MKATSSQLRLTALLIAVALVIAGFAAVTAGVAGANGSASPSQAESEGLEDGWADRQPGLPPIFSTPGNLPEDGSGDGTPSSEDGSGEDTRLTENSAGVGTSSEERSHLPEGRGPEEQPHSIAGTGTVVRMYTVQPGDNLTYIAKDEYGIAEDRAAYLQALAIWDANRELIGADPDFILPDQTLDLPAGDQAAAESAGNSTPPAGEQTATARVGPTTTEVLGGAISGDVAGVADVGSGQPEVVVQNPAGDAGTGTPTTSDAFLGVMDVPPAVLMIASLVIAIVLAIAVWAVVTEVTAAAAARASPSGTKAARRDDEHGRSTAEASTATPSTAGLLTPSRNGQSSHVSAGAESQSKTPLVLLAEADVSAAGVVARELAGEGLAIVVLRSGKEALLQLEEMRPDIVVVDESMPDMPGVALMQQLQRCASIPVILLLSRNSTADRIRLLDSGADDCLTKPVNAAELSARIRAVLRRTNGGAKRHAFQPVIQVKDLEIDLQHRTVRRNGDLVELSTTEWQLLRYLAMNAGRVIGKEEILTSVWGNEYRDAGHYLRVWIPRLRRRLRSSHAARSIKTIHGMGYVFEI